MASKAVSTTLFRDSNSSLTTAIRSCSPYSKQQEPLQELTIPYHASESTTHLGTLKAELQKPLPEPGSQVVANLNPYCTGILVLCSSSTATLFL